MVFREPVVRAIVVLAIVAPERKINLDTALFALQTQKAPYLPDVSAHYLLLT
jgi:hypothetical protein